MASRILTFRVISKMHGIIESETTSGKISASAIEDALRAAFHRFRGTDLDTIVDAYSRRSSRRGYFSKFSVQRFFDAEKREQGACFGDADCMVIAAERLTADEVTSISAVHKQNRNS